ncbi:LOW QUALITY PROTEIN: ubiquitin carboxyl-terminal hydrolase 1-like [Amphiura filiformis]|uniref:LOW QUALITY PROTEIN: ubiquitin carboxyl-terminal hydrolase 1-like n=1 Tax=Amphiura filiformis TaxID=82378 RepID=UPI003B21EF8F
MATQSPVKKKPRLSLKLTRKDNRNITDDDEKNEDAPPDIDNTNDTNDYHLFENQSEEPQELPPPYCGLNNLGNTCYFNSVLQALRYTPGFCDGLRNLAEVAKNVEDDTSPRSKTDSKQKKQSQDSRMLLQLVIKLNQLFDEMKAKEEQFAINPSPDQEMSIYPEEVLDSLRELNPMFQGYLQHDSQELLCSLLSKLQDASQKLLQIAKEEKENPKRYKHSKLSLVKSPPEKSENEKNADDKLRNDRKCQNSAAENLSKISTNETNTPVVADEKVKTSESSITNGSGGSMNGSGIVNGNGKVKTRKRRSSSRDSEASNEDSTPQRKVKKESTLFAPSSDSVVKNKTGMSGDQYMNGINGNSNDELNPAGVVNGSGDANGKTKDKANSGKTKKRLGLGRIRVPFNQPTILSKFGFSKKDGTPVNGIRYKKLEDHDEVNGTENGTDTNQHLMNGKCESISDVKPETNGVVCYNQTNNNSNQSQPHLPNSSEESAKSKADSKSPVSELSTKSATSTNSKNSVCHETKTVSNESASSTNNKSGCQETDRAATNESEVECLGTVSNVDKQLQTVEKMFQGSLVLRTRCMECEGFTERREEFQDISVPVQKMDKVAESDEEDQLPGSSNNLSLSWALSEFACAEKLTAENKYFCESCRHHTEAERTMLFGSLPPVLSVQLKRFCAFAGSLAFGGISKVNDHLATPLTLCLTQWCTKQCRQRKQKYALFAVVMHSGVSSSSGHYVCYSRIPVRQVTKTYDDVTDIIDRDNSREVWGHFDDDRVTIYSDQEFHQLLHPINNSFTTATPYLLFYKRMEMV